MACSIDIENVNLKFRLYKDKNLSLKQTVVDMLSFKRFSEKNYSDFYALKDVSLKIKEGERVGVIGLNGAGKSTLLKAIAKIYSPQDGKIKTNGKVVPLLELGAGFNPEFSGRENIYLNGAMLGVRKKEMKALEKDIIDFSGLSEFIDLPIKHFSSGMYAKLAFTIATSIHPEILILDEVFAGGDAKFIKKAKKRMNEVIYKAKIVLFVSHTLDLIKSTCSRVIIMNKGEVAFDGPTAEALVFYENQILNSPT